MRGFRLIATILMSIRGRIGFFGGGVFAQQSGVTQRYTSEFVTKTQNAGIDIIGLATDDPLSRYDLARLMNLVECYDCLDPGPSMRRVYIPSFWESFTQLPSKDFDDILYQEAKYAGSSYYYCVAYVGDMNYMRGYPRSTSPICRGGFCGEKYATKAEFIQVVVNIAKRYIFDTYRANRSAMKEWMDDLETGSYAERNLDTTMKNIITDRAERCPAGECQLASHKELETYMIYCMFNLNACGFSRFGWIGEGYWPVSELNILANERLLPLDDTPRETIHEPVSGKYAISILGELHKRVGCVLNNDYDCDTLSNIADNCPNDYNPNQYDRDGDTIGDVCDTDINNDGNPNLPGIVDDNGTVSIAVLNKSPDKTVYTSPPVTSPVGPIGSPSSPAGPSNQAKKQAIQIRGTQTFLSQILLPGPINRNMADGRTREGTSVQTDYILPGTYTLISQQDYAVARKSISIPQSAIRVGIAAIPSSLPTTGFPRTINRKIQANDETSINRTLGEMSGAAKPGNDISISILQGGTYQLTAYGSIADRQVSLTQMSLDAGFFAERSTRLTASSLTAPLGSSVTITAMYQGRERENARITRSIGTEKQPATGSTLTITPTEAGIQYVSFSAVFPDGGMHSAIITISSYNPSQEQTKIVGITVDELKKGINDEFVFSPDIQGFASGEIQALSVDFGDGKIVQYPFDTKIIRYRYTKPDVYTVTIKPIGLQCIDMIGQLTLVVDHAIDCEKHLKDGTLGQFRCDMDADGVPDVCDDDISGDGSPNLLGLLLYENEDCSIGPNSIITSINPDQSPTEQDDGPNGQNGNETLSGVSTDLLPLAEANILKPLTPAKPYRLSGGTPRASNINRELLNRHAGVCGLSACPFISIGEVIDLDGDGMDDRCEPFLRPGAGPDTNQIPEKQSQADQTGDLFDNPLDPETVSPAPDDSGGPNTTNPDDILTQPDPLRDSDGDGVPDSDDRCPDKAWDGNIRAYGCPAPDADGDGVADAIDQCPSVPGTSDNGGCILLAEQDPCFVYPDMPKGYIAAVGCNQCPCPFADIGGDIAPSDLIRAVLLNPNGTKLYDISGIRTVTAEDIEPEEEEELQ